MGTGAWCCLQHVSVGQTWFRMSRLWSVVRPRSLPARDQENGRGAWRAAVPGTQNAFHVVSLLKPHSYGSGAGVARRGGAYFFYPPAVLCSTGAERPKRCMGRSRGRTASVTRGGVRGSRVQMPIGRGQAAHGDPRPRPDILHLDQAPADARSGIRRTARQPRRSPPLRARSPGTQTASRGAGGAALARSGQASASEVTARPCCR